MVSSKGKLAKVWDIVGATSIQDVLQQSHTDWDIQSHKAWVSTESQQGVPSTIVDHGGHQVLVRPDSNTALAFVSERYRANSHRRQLYSLDGLVTSGQIVPATVSVWDNGAVLAYQFRCPELDMTIQGRDVVSPLLTLAFSYGFPLADTAFFADFRWFCKNQMGRVAKLTEERVSHRGDVSNKYVEVLQRRVQELKGELVGHYADMRGLLEKPVRGPMSLAQYFGASLGLKPEVIDAAWVNPEEAKGPAKQIAEVLDCYLADDCGAPDTMWQAYNAVTRYQTHNHGRNEATRQRVNLLGAGNAVMNRAMALAVAA